VSEDFNALMEMAKELWSNNNEDENKEDNFKYPF
jgi:hypothetical protein